MPFSLIILYALATVLCLLNTLMLVKNGDMAKLNSENARENLEMWKKITERERMSRSRVSHTVSKADARKRMKQLRKARVVVNNYR